MNTDLTDRLNNYLTAMFLALGDSGQGAKEKVDLEKKTIQFSILNSVLESMSEEQKKMFAVDINSKDASQRLSQMLSNLLNDPKYQSLVVSTFNEELKAVEKNFLEVATGEQKTSLFNSLNNLSK